MKKMYKAMALVLCAALLVAGSIFGTLAYLQDKTDPVKNTFTTGKVDITLHEFEIDNATGEKKVAKDAEGNVVTDANGNETYVKAESAGLTGIKLVPGREIKKNPVITVKEGSEACYLFVKVEDGLSNLATINWVEGDWTKIDGTNIYYYKAIVAAPDDKDANKVSDVEVVIFPSITCANVTTYETAADISLAITAYAVQAEGFETVANTFAECAAAAWTATYGTPATP